MTIGYLNAEARAHPRLSLPLSRCVTCPESESGRERDRQKGDTPRGQGEHQFVPTMLKSPAELERNSNECARERASKRERSSPRCPVNLSCQPGIIARLDFNEPSAGKRETRPFYFSFLSSLYRWLFFFRWETRPIINFCKRLF